MKNKTKSGFTIIIMIGAVIVMSGWRSRSWSQDKYRILYSYLEEKLNNFDSYLDSQWDGKKLVLKKYYKDLNLAKYKQEKREQIKKVLTYIQPDLLTVEIEPGTMARNTGLRELYDPKIFREVIEYQIKDVQKGNTLIGAGIGTWDDKAFAKELVQVSKLDYLDLHIYPITKDYLQRALDYSDLAKSHNKKVISGEAWLYKATEKEVKQGGATVMEAFRRDVFSFWIPLDKKFHEVLIKLAHYKQFDFISPFWTRHYFAYLDYNNWTKDLPAGKLFTKVNREAFKNLVVGKFTETALHYKELISGDISPGEAKANYPRDCLVKKQAISDVRRIK